jgi:hypothetical protein
MIGSHGDDFDGRNVFLHLALGLVSASRRLDRILARHARRPPEGPRSPPTREDELLVDFALGLISFRDNARSTLASARRAPLPAPRLVERAPLRGVLR